MKGKRLSSKINSVPEMICNGSLLTNIMNIKLLGLEIEGELQLTLFVRKFHSALACYRKLQRLLYYNAMIRPVINYAGVLDKRKSHAVTCDTNFDQQIVKVNTEHEVEEVLVGKSILSVFNVFLGQRLCIKTVGTVRFTVFVFVSTFFGDHKGTLAVLLSVFSLPTRPCDISIASTLIHTSSLSQSFKLETDCSRPCS